MKISNVTTDGKHCYFSGISTDIRDIVNYKSWQRKSHGSMTTVRYVTIAGNGVIRTSFGFAPLLIRHLAEIGYIVRQNIFDYHPISVPVMRLQLYDFQNRLVEDWIGHGGTGVLKAPTGSGKTLIGCSAISRIRGKTLILTHTSDLLINVWTDSLVKAFGTDIMQQVGIVGGGLGLDDRASMQTVTDDDFYRNMDKDIVIATYQTLANHLDVLSYYKFGLCLMDECHHTPAVMFRRVGAGVRSWYKMGLSATLTRLDGLTDDIFGQIGNIAGSVSIRELIAKNILAEPVFYTTVINDVGAQRDIAGCGLRGFDLARYVKKASAASVRKRDYVVSLVHRMVATGRSKFLLFTDYVSAEDVWLRDTYADLLAGTGVRLSIIDMDMSSEERNTVFRMLDSGKIDGIIFGRLGSEGINIPHADVVVMANAIKSSIAYCQRVGRVMRRTAQKNHCTVHEIVLNTPMELRWSRDNFSEYKLEGFRKVYMQ